MMPVVGISGLQPHTYYSPNGLILQVKFCAGGAMVMLSDQFFTPESNGYRTCFARFRGFYVVQ